MDPARVKVLDETGIIRGLRLLYGYAPRGERVYDRAPYGKGKRLNLLGWIGLDGKGCLAAYVGNVNKEVFTCFVKKRLVPELKPGDIVLWDNASFHRGDELKKMIEKRGATIKALPRYSPDYNPIELLWSKLKHYIKKARADTFKALEPAVEKALAMIKVSDVRGWYQHCGFNISM